MLPVLIQVAITVALVVLLKLMKTKEKRTRMEFSRKVTMKISQIMVMKTA